MTKKFIESKYANKFSLTSLSLNNHIVSLVYIYDQKSIEREFSI